MTALPDASISFEEYKAIDAVNQSALKLMKASPLHAITAMREERADTPAMILGRAAHTAILEPDEFDRRYMIYPQADRRTKAGKELYEQVRRQANGRELIEDRKFDTLKGMIASARDHAEMRRLLELSGSAEVSIVWDDRSGVRCKARIDKVAIDDGVTTILDLKTARVATPWVFGRAAAELGYHFQAAFYMRGLDHVAGEADRRFLFLALESVSPFSAVVYELDKQAMVAARSMVDEYLEAWNRCQAADSWPGPGDSGVTRLELPAWAITGGMLSEVAQGEVDQCG